MNNTPSDTTPRTAALAALASIQAKLRARKDKRNDFGGYSYRNKEGILEAVKPLLAEHGAAITITDEPVAIGSRYYIQSVASFRIGVDVISTVGYAREQDSKKGMDEAQVTGAASSYAGKYALCNLLAIDDSSADPDATTDHDKRLPDLSEIELILRCSTYEELGMRYKLLSKKGIASGYLADLCKQRKETLNPEPSTPTA